MRPRLNTFFSGGGLFDLGLRRAGMEIQQSFELDRHCCATLRANFDHEVVECDLTKKLAKETKRADAHIYTYPCRAYAEIAAIHGKRSGDELFLHALRLMVLNPPAVFVAENVPGMLKFPVVMEVMTKLPDYYVTVFCPVDSATWLPQRRERLIIIGSRRSFQWNKPRAQKRVKLSQIVERDVRMNVPGYVRKRLRGHYRDLPIISDPSKDDLAPTCVAHYAKDRSTRLVRDKRFKGGVRPYTVREYARLQGVPDDFVFVGGESAAYRMIGNGVSVPVGEWIGRELRRYFR